VNAGASSLRMDGVAEL